MTFEESLAEARRRNAGISPTPTPTIKMAPSPTATAQMTDVGKQKVNNFVNKQKRPLQQGLGVISDVLNVLEYPLAGFQKGAWDEGQKIKAERGITDKKLRFSTPKEAIRRIGAGIKNIPTGFKERTTLTETVPQMLGDMGVKNKAIQAGAGLISSLAVPTIPFGKVSKAIGLEKSVPKLISKMDDIPALKKAKDIVKEFTYKGSAPEDFLARTEAYNIAKSKQAERAGRVATPLQFTKEGKELSRADQEELFKAIEMVKGLPGTTKELAARREKLLKELLDIQYRKTSLNESFKYGGRVNIEKPLLLGPGVGVGDGNIKKIKPLMKSGEGFILPTLEQRKTVKLLQQSEKQASGILDELSNIEKIEKQREVTPEILKKWNPVIEETRRNFDKYRKELIAEGADPAIFDKWANNYFGKTLYGKYMQKSGTAVPFSKSGRPAMETGIYKEKMEYIPEEIEKELEKFGTGAYGAALSAFASGNNLETMKYFKWIAKKYVNKGDDLIILPKVERLGILSGKKVPKQIAAKINEIIPYIPKAEDTFGQVAGFLPKSANFITKRFKEFKTVLSPKQLVRNPLTNLVAMYMNPSGRADAIREIPEATMIYFGKNKGKFYQKAKSVGLVGQTFTSEVINQFIPQELSKFKKSNNIYSKAVGAGGKVQSAAEEISKLAVFINELKDKKTVMEAAKAAEESLFNYQKVSPLVKKLRSGPIPFLTYPLKATELTAKTLYKQPKRLKNIGSMERAVQGLSEPGNEQFMPDYLRNSVRLPFKSPTTGKPIYLNAKYLYPFGNLFEGGSPLGLTPNPLLMEAISLWSDRDAYRQMQNFIEGRDPGDIERLSDQELLNIIPGRLRHTIETFSPTFVRSLFKAFEAATKRGLSPTQPSVFESIISEAGIPIYQYDEQAGFNIQRYNKTEKTRELKSEMDKYLKETKVTAPFYKQGLDRRRQAWLDSMKGK